MSPTSKESKPGFGARAGFHAITRFANIRHYNLARWTSHSCRKGHRQAAHPHDHIVAEYTDHDQCRGNKANHYRPAGDCEAHLTTCASSSAPRIGSKSEQAILDPHIASYTLVGYRSCPPGPGQDQLSPVGQSDCEISTSGAGGIGWSRRCRRCHRCRCYRRRCRRCRHRRCCRRCRHCRRRKSKCVAHRPYM